MMAGNKTQKNRASVAEFLDRIEDESVREDCEKLIEVMQSITKCPPSMWGESIIGFGAYQYRYASGREGEWFLTGFSPRKRNLSLYAAGCDLEQYQELVSQLGDVKHGKSCLYVKRLSEIHLPTLKKLIRASVKQLKQVDKETRKEKSTKAHK